MAWIAKSLSPMVPSYDLGATAEFFRNSLGFSAVLQSDGYAVLVREGASLHLLPAGDDIGQMEMYLEVDDVDVAWAAMQPHTGGLRTRGPFDREYGMREVHVEVPHTKCLLFVGHAL